MRELNPRPLVPEILEKGTRETPLTYGNYVSFPDTSSLLLKKAHFMRFKFS